MVEVTLALAREMLDLVDVDIDPAEMLASGEPREVFERMVVAQGGDLANGLPVAKHQQELNASSSGYLNRLDCYSVGVAAWRLGAGRAKKEDSVSPTAGVVCLAKPGEYVEAGQPLLELHCDEPDKFDFALNALEDAIDIGDQRSELFPLIVDRIAQ